MSKVCKECGKELHGKQLSFCGKECREKYTNGSNFERTCAVCGCVFIGTRQKKYCNDCKGKEIKKCVTCGKEIIGAKSKKYCSRSCQNNNATTIICKSCGVEFKGSYTKVYCSEECMNNSFYLKSRNIIDLKLNKIKEKYPDFEITDSEIIENKLNISMKCKYDSNIINSQYETLIKKDEKCIKCEETNYYKTPNFCCFCGDILSYESRKRKYCNDACLHDSYKKNKEDDQIKFNAECGDIISNLSKCGHSALYISSEFGFKIAKVNNFLNDNKYLKNDFSLMDSKLFEIIKNNNTLDMRSFGFHQEASCLFKEKYKSMLNFLNINNINYNEKLFKCATCGEYYNLEDFSIRTPVVKSSFFGVGTCKHCVKIYKSKRKRKSKEIDKFLNASYFLKIKEKFNNKCAICGDDSSLHTDHFIPLSWNIKNPIKGNYILLCERCNVKHKSDRNINDWNLTYDKDYSSKIKDIMKWLALENNMSFLNYNNLYWECYNKHIENQNQAS